jgi:hypothetical protein
VMHDDLEGWLVGDGGPMISALLLSLVDYILRKASYWSIHKYEDRVDEDRVDEILRKGFVEHVEKSHRDNMDELEGK